jgi:hypothetical protein
MACPLLSLGAMESPTRVIAGVTVPDTDVVSRALESVRSESNPFLFNHVVRSWLYAVRLGQLQDLSYDPEVVAVGTLFHDIGRFVLEAADMASDFARSVGMGGQRARLVWHCVALNSSRCLALSREVESVLCSEGTTVDIEGAASGRVPAAEMELILNEFPRLLQEPNLGEFCGGWPVKGGVRDARAYWPLTH